MPTGCSSTSAVGTAGRVAATSTADSAARITVISPPGKATVHITVTTPAGVVTTVGTFTYVSPSSRSSRPAISGVSPASGSTAGGTRVTIAGTGLSGTTGVSFGGAAALITADSATQITGTSPPGTGTVHITVTTPAGTSAGTSADRFTYIAPPPPPPAVTPVSPTNASTAGGTTGRNGG